MILQRRLFIFATLFLIQLASVARVSAASADQRFGVMTHFAHGWDPVWADIAALRGITTVRDELYWDAVEREKGVFTFPRQFDIYMDALKRNGIAPLIVLSFENRNYDQGDTPYTSEAFSAFGRYGTEVLKRYGNMIQTVEVWNEYNGTFCKGPATHDRAGTYAKMLREAYAQIKQLRPNVTVLGGATAGIPLPYWEKLMQNGGLQSMDALSIHPYRYNAPPEGLETEVAALQTMVRKYNGGESKPIWVTEIGWGTQSAASAPGTLVIDEATQARYLVRAYALLLSAPVERVYWYLLRDYEDFTMGLTSADARPKPASFALQVMARELSRARFVRRELSSAGLYSILFARPSGEEVRVIWALQPASIAPTGATRVVDIEGRVHSVASPISLNDSPVFVTGPLVSLPPAPKTVAVLADSRTGFSSEQGGNRWSFGESLGSDPTFHLLPNYTVSDWNAAWGGRYAYLFITAGDQHPSVTGEGIPVSAVRRWTSDRAASVRITGEYRCGVGGDGVGVSVLVDGRPLLRRWLGGNSPAVSFDLEADVGNGSTIDFTVDPGPLGDISFDATQVSVSISAR